MLTRFELMCRIEDRVRRHKSRAKERKLLQYLTTKQIKREIQNEKRAASKIHQAITLFGLFG